MKLLTRGNTKTVKGERRGYITFILHLAPAKLSGYEVCGGRSPECTDLCLNMAGRGKFDATQHARIKKTRWFFEDRISFMAQLVKDISAAIRYGVRNRMQVCIRLNGTSDIPWESIRCGNFINIMERFPFIQFYDYTKLPGRKNLPDNYHLTFSLSETNHAKAFAESTSGRNVAIVFDSVPLLWKGKPVVAGDEDDLRFLDPPGHIIGLKAKGKAIKSQSAFVQRTTNGQPTNHPVSCVTHRRASQGSQGGAVRTVRARAGSKQSSSLSR